MQHVTSAQRARTQCFDSAHYLLHAFANKFVFFQKQLSQWQEPRQLLRFYLPFSLLNTQQRMWPMQLVRSNQKLHLPYGLLNAKRNVQSKTCSISWALLHKVDINFSCMWLTALLRGIYTGYLCSYKNFLKPGTPPLRSTRELDEFRERIRCMHYSLSSEQVDVYWVRFFIRWRR
jgi:hypothetical protein